LGDGCFLNHDGDCVRQCLDHLLVDQKLGAGALSRDGTHRRDWFRLRRRTLWVLGRLWPALPCVWPFYLPGICAAAVSIVLRGSALALRYLALGRSSQRRPVALPPNRTVTSLQAGNNRC